jgi:hypothetical protein
MSIFSKFAHSLGHGFKALGKLAKNVTTSPVWKVVAGAAVVIPGIGVPLSAGMVAAAAIGKATSVKDAIVGAVRENLPGGDAAKLGYDAAMGVVVDGKGISDVGLATIRQQLPENARAGFDTALTMHFGRTQGKAAPAHLPMTARGAYYAALGAHKVGAPAAMKKRVLEHASAGPGAKAGLRAAADDLLKMSSEDVFEKLVDLARKVEARDRKALSTYLALVTQAKTNPKAKKLLELYEVAKQSLHAPAPVRLHRTWLQKFWADISALPHKLSASLTDRTPKTTLTVRAG